MRDFSISMLLQMFIFSIISFAIFMHTSDNYKLSNILFIKILQKIVFLFLKFILLLIIINILGFPLSDIIYCEGGDEEDDDGDEVVGNNKQSKGKEIVRVSTKSRDEVDLLDVKDVVVDKGDYYNIKVNKKTLENISDNTVKLSKFLAENYGPGLAAGLLSGKVAGAALKHYGGMGPLPRIAFTAGAAATTVTATGLSMQATGLIKENKNTNLKIDIVKSKPKDVEIEPNESVASSPNQSPTSPEIQNQSTVSSNQVTGSSNQVTGSSNKLTASSNQSTESSNDSTTDLSPKDPSPTEFNGGFIQSVLEESEIPLVELVQILYFLDYIEFSLIFSVFSILFRKYFIKVLIHLISKFTNKQVEKVENVSLNKILNNILKKILLNTKFL